MRKGKCDRGSRSERTRNVRMEGSYGRIQPQEVPSLGAGRADQPANALSTHSSKLGSLPLRDRPPCGRSFPLGGASSLGAGRADQPANALSTHSSKLGSLPVHWQARLRRAPCIGGERGIRTPDTPLRVYALSRRAPSTTRPSLLIACICGGKALRVKGGQITKRSFPRLLHAHRNTGALTHLC